MVISQKCVYEFIDSMISLLKIIGRLLFLKAEYFRIHNDQRVCKYLKAKDVLIFMYNKCRDSLLITFDVCVIHHLYLQCSILIRRTNNFVST